MTWEWAALIAALAHCGWGVLHTCLGYRERDGRHRYQAKEELELIHRAVASLQENRDIDVGDWSTVVTRLSSLEERYASVEKTAKEAEKLLSQKNFAASFPAMPTAMRVR